MALFSAVLALCYLATAAAIPAFDGPKALNEVSAERIALQRWERARDALEQNNKPYGMKPCDAFCGMPGMTDSAFLSCEARAKAFFTCLKASKAAYDKTDPWSLMTALGPAEECWKKIDDEQIGCSGARMWDYSDCNVQCNSHLPEGSLAPPEVKPVTPAPVVQPPVTPVVNKPVPEEPPTASPASDCTAKDRNACENSNPYKKVKDWGGAKGKCKRFPKCAKCAECSEEPPTAPPASDCTAKDRNACENSNPYKQVKDWGGAKGKCKRFPKCAKCAECVTKDQD